MYVITDHNNGNFVLLGPIEWRPRYISDIIYDEFFEEISLTKEDESRVPFEILPGVKVRRCQSTYEEINPKINRLEGPLWTYDDDNPEVQATAAWVKADKSMDQVKAELKSVVANLRWQKENKGVTLTIQNTEVWCDTSRGNRDVFLQKYSLMGDADTINWKFPGDIWLTLTKPELGYIVFSGATYIQSCFDWEAAQGVIIDGCTTLEELDSLTFEENDG